MNWLLFMAIFQTMVLAVSALVILHQTRALARTSRANFQHEVFRNIIENRNRSLMEATKAFAEPPIVQEMLKFSDGSPQMLAWIRGMLDLYYDAFKLYKAKFIDEDTWKTFEYLITANLQSPHISGIWNVICQTNAYSQDFIRVVNNLGQQNVKITGFGDSQNSQL